MHKMKQLTILVDLHHLYVADTGIRKYLEDFIDLIKESPSKRHHYVFVPKIEKVVRRSNYRKKKGKLYRLISQLETFLWKQLYFPIKAYKVKADVSFFPDYYAPIFSLRGKKLVMFHDTFFWDTPEHYGRVWLKYFRCITLQGIKTNAQIITITNFAKRNLLKVVPNNVEIEVIYQPQRLTGSLEVGGVENTLSELGLKNQRYFLHVGVFEKRKNLLVLLKAFQKFVSIPGYSEYKLVLVGKPAPNKRFDDFLNAKEFVAAHQLNDRVMFPGYLSDSAVAHLFSGAMSYVFPSSNEGFGLPILEAFALKCPIIISNQGALLEVTNGAAMVFEMSNYDDLCECMTQMCKSPEERERLIQQGQIRLNAFNRNDYLVQMEALFDHIANR